MNARELIEILHLAERLKDTPRHSWTSRGRQESVAEHSWRLALMSWFIRDEFPGADWQKVMAMAVLHDMGEAFTGDIPAFWKTNADREMERHATDSWCASLTEPYGSELRALFEEMEALQTLESRIVKALDKLEVLVQHNEADLSTWLPLEYEKNLVHADPYVEFSEYMTALRDEIRMESVEKIQDGGSGERYET